MEQTKKTNLFNKKQKDFINLLIDGNGVLDIGEAAKQLNVSKPTIYNYYHLLKNLTFEMRKGNVKLHRSEQEIPDPFTARHTHNRVLKERIATYVVDSLIKHNDLVYLDCGSTAVYVAEYIRERELQNITLITANPYVLARLITYEKLRELSVIGGTLNRNSGAFFGPWVNILLSSINYRIQKSFLGADGIRVFEKKGIITLANKGEVNQKKAIMDMSDETYILLDESKIRGAGEFLLKYPEEWNHSIKVILSCTDENSKDVSEVREIFKDNLIILKVEAPENDQT